MSLHDFTPGFERAVVKRIRELAEATANIGDQAPFAKLSSSDETARLPRWTDLSPEAENTSRRNDDSINTPQSDPEILDFSELPGPFCRGDPFARIELGN
jgi:hypothetical protein